MKLNASLFAAVGAAVVYGLTGTAMAQVVQPQPFPAAAPIAPPQDIPYPGVLKLNVDATDLGPVLIKLAGEFDA